MPPSAAADVPRRLAGKVALVTGAARGIGLAIAKRLGAEGAAVILSDIDADVVAVSATSLSALGLAHDIADPSSSTRVMGEIDQRFGRLDILVNNAAVLDASPWDALDFDQYRRVMDVNLDGALRVTMAAVPLIERCGGGSILNIASIMGVLGSRASIPYSTAKGGIVNLTRCLACDLGEKGIRVNAIAPGFIDTRMARLPDGSHEHATEFFQQVYLGHGRIPARRAGQPDDIAGPASFLVSDDAAYVTGQILMVDGGVSATF